jgi:hypothetical protein
VIVDRDDAQTRSRIGLRDKAAQTAVDTGGLIARRDNDGDLWRAIGRRRLGGLETLQKTALLESAGDQPDHDRQPNP